MILGIDPDFNGAMAVVHSSSNVVAALRSLPVFDPPLKKHPRRIDAPTFHAFLIEQRTAGVQWVVVEQAITKMQQTPRGPMMTKGIDVTHQTYGAVRAIAETVFGRGRVYAAHPSTWKAAMKLDGDKDKSLAMATELYPGHKLIFAKKKNHGLAEAVLLAHYGKSICT